MGQQAVEPTNEDVALEQWTLWLQAYAKGHERPPPPPLRRSTPLNGPPAIPDFSIPLYPPGQISPAIARTIAEFYGDYGFLPPPRADEETVRLQAIQEYNLFRQDQLENFHRCSSLVNVFFDFAPICTISLFHNDVQVVVSKAGDFPVQLGEGLVTETSICGHVVLQKKTTELNEIAGDWRFAGNPWCSADAGVKGYIGVPITLEVDPSNPNDSERVTVGVVALMSNKPFPKLTDTQRKVLDDLSAMLSVQLRSTWEGWRRGKETRLRNAVSVFLTKALVEPTRRAMPDAAAALAEPPVQGSGSGRSTPRSDDLTMSSPAPFDYAAQQLHDLLEADFAIILDLASFHASKLHVNGRRQTSHNWLGDEQEVYTKMRPASRILASSGSAAYSDHDKRFVTPEAMFAIGSFLDRYAVNGRSLFSGSDGVSGLEALLALPLSSPPVPVAARGFTPAETHRPAPHLAIPFYSADRPSLLIIVASSALFSPFKPVDLTFASNLGVVLVAHRAQASIVEADAAKTAFVSQIRTPLHGLLGQLDLVRDSVSSGETSTLLNLLDSAEFCGAALRDIVDDVLDFGKMTLSTGDSTEACQPRPPQPPVDLAQITLEATRSCWTRQLQRLRHSVSGLGAKLAPSLELVLDCEDRSGLVRNWWLSFDTTGFIRILNNLVTNSLKYTPEGLVKVTLASGHGPDKDENDTPHVILRVEDTGVGIAPEYLDRLFEPFTQADSFSPGAGLGLHICSTIVARMRGEISVESQPDGGSVFTVVLPVKHLELVPAGTSLPMRRTIISGEMRAKMDALCASALDHPFGQAISQANPTPPPSPPDVTKPSNASAVKLGQEEQHLQILIVDDNVISRKILVAMLKRMNATAHQADDGMNALEVFREVHPHVVWTDVSMPRMDGVTAAKEMRKIERERGWAPSHIVAITGLGLSDEHIRKEALLGPAALDGWLIKGQTNLKSLKESLVAVRHKISSYSQP